MSDYVPNCRSIFTNVVLMQYLVSFFVIITFVAAKQFAIFALPSIISLFSCGIQSRSNNVHDVTKFFDYFVQIFSALFVASLICQVNSTQPLWSEYSALYGSLVNSVAFLSLISGCYDSISSVVMKENESISSITTIVSKLTAYQYLKHFVILLVFIPAIATHIVPGLVVYAWYFVTELFLIVLMTAMVGNVLMTTDSTYRFICKHELLTQRVVEVFVLFIVTTICQSAYNYAYLFYALPRPLTRFAYLGVINFEYNLRQQSLSCYLEFCRESFGGVLRYVMSGGAVWTCVCWYCC